MKANDNDKKLSKEDIQHVFSQLVNAVTKKGIHKKWGSKVSLEKYAEELKGSFKKYTEK